MWLLNVILEVEHSLPSMSWSPYRQQGSNIWIDKIPVLRDRNQKKKNTSSAIQGPGETSWLLKQDLREETQNEL